MIGENWEEVDYYGDERDDKALRKDFKFKNFKDALDFVNQVGSIAEKTNHHPDLNLSWGLVRVWLTTHSEHKITKKDRDMAKAIDQILK